MTEERLSRANELSNFVNDYKEVIGRYCNGMSANENRNKYAPKESADIKNAIKKALNSIQKEFDEI